MRGIKRTIDEVNIDDINPTFEFRESILKKSKVEIDQYFIEYLKEYNNLTEEQILTIEKKEIDILYQEYLKQTTLNISRITRVTKKGNIKYDFLPDTDFLKMNIKSGKKHDTRNGICKKCMKEPSIDKFKLKVVRDLLKRAGLNTMIPIFRDYVVNIILSLVFHNLPMECIFVILDNLNFISIEEISKIILNKIWDPHKIQTNINKNHSWKDHGLHLYFILSYSIDRSHELEYISNKLFRHGHDFFTTEIKYLDFTKDFIKGKLNLHQTEDDKMSKIIRFHTILTLISLEFNKRFCRDTICFNSELVSGIESKRLFPTENKEINIYNYAEAFGNQNVKYPFTAINFQYLKSVKKKPKIYKVDNHVLKPSLETQINKKIDLLEIDENDQLDFLNFSKKIFSDQQNSDSISLNSSKPNYYLDEPTKRKLSQDFTRRRSAQMEINSSMDEGGPAELI